MGLKDLWKGYMEHIDRRAQRRARFMQGDPSSKAAKRYARRQEIKEAEMTWPWEHDPVPKPTGRLISPRLRR